ncbi:MAG: hypothetical protein NT062_08855 [Proteobacteria bacterium]|nr:hypothetical protein [Pseudomonadota bacterium]
MTDQAHPTCDVVAERCALGEPLAEHADHAATCPTCTRLTATASALAGTRHVVDPGVGFAARMMVATQQRIAERRRLRVVGGLAGMVVVGALGVFVMTRGPGALPDRPAPVAAPAPDPDRDPADPRPIDPALRALVRFSDTHTNTHLSARWGHVERSLVPYRALVKGLK